MPNLQFVSRMFRTLLSFIVNILLAKLYLFAKGVKMDTIQN